MALHNLPGWPAERPRSQSLCAPADARAFAGVRPLVPGTDTFTALDLETTPRAKRARTAEQAGMCGAPRPSLRQDGMLDLAPMPRPPQRRTDYQGLWAESNDVVAAEPRSWPAALSLPTDAADLAASRLWPRGDVTLLRGSQERFVLYGDQGRVFGPDSGVSLFSLHDERTSHLFDSSVLGRRPVVFGVAKTFAFHDLDLRWHGNRASHGRGIMRAAEPERVQLEVNYSLTQFQNSAAPQSYEGHASPVGSASLGRTYRAAPARSAPQQSSRSVAKNAPSFAATCVQPLAVLRQNDASGNFVHVLYPMSLLDAAKLLELQRRAQHDVATRRASSEAVGHALLLSPMYYLSRMHYRSLAHQDIKLENVLFHLDWHHVSAAKKMPAHTPQELEARLARTEPPRMAARAYLVDFGHVTKHGRGVVPNSTVYMHAPEAFLLPAEVRAAPTRGPGQTWPAGSFFSRQENDKWALGLVLMRLLTPGLPGPSPARANPALTCPLVADYHLDFRCIDPVTQQLVADELDDNLLADNYRSAQALLKRWVPAHAAWAAYAATRGTTPRPPRPTGNWLPTPNGARIDEALGEIDSLQFDFLQFVLALTEPTPARIRLSDLNILYTKLITIVREEQQELYEPGRVLGRRALLEMLQSQPMGFEAQAAARKAALQAASATPEAPSLGSHGDSTRPLMAPAMPVCAADADVDPEANLGFLPTQAAPAPEPWAKRSRFFHFLSQLARPRRSGGRGPDRARPPRWFNFAGEAQERAPLLPIARSPDDAALPELEADFGSLVSNGPGPLTPEQSALPVPYAPLAAPSGASPGSPRSRKRVLNGGPLF